MSKSVTGILRITDVPVIVGDESYQIDLEQVHTIHTGHRIDGLSKPFRRQTIIQNSMIKKVGRNFDVTLAELTSRSQLVKRQVSALERLHGDVNGDEFRFRAEKLNQED